MNVKHYFSVAQRFLRKHIIAILLCALIFSLALFFTYDVSLVARRKRLQIHSFPLSNFSPAAYPLLSQPLTASISAQSALVMDRTSQVILYEKNPQLVLSPASTTKILTAVLGLGTFQPSDILTVKTPVTQPVTMGYQAGQQVTFENILYAMMLPSANDAALVVADNFPGGKESFITAMNEKAQQLHLKKTHFADPIGLEDDGDYTTVVDLARLTDIALQNPLFTQVVGTKYFTAKTIDGVKTAIKNKNDLLGFYGVNGVKTGYTEGAKEVLVTSVRQDNHDYIIVVMGSDDRFGDTKTLLSLLPHVIFQSMSLE